MGVEECSEFPKRVPILTDPFRGSPFWQQDFAINGVGNGIDRCSVPKMQRKIEDTSVLIVRTFTDEEIVYCEQADSPQLRAERYAGRFAAKEAVIKALGGISKRGFSYQDIHIIRGESGKPYVFLEGRAKTRANALGVRRFNLSITHDEDAAEAWCLALKGDEPSDAH